MRTPSILVKTLILTAALLAVCPPRGRAQEKSPTDQNVAIAATLSRDTVARGAGAEVVFTVRPKKGFHVNAVPPLGVAFDSTARATKGGKIVIPTDTSTGYLKPSLPVRQPFTLAAAAPKGRTQLKGVLTYYYCSDAEGWCRKETLRFSIPITVQ
jgi:hypothetical protein